MRDSTITQLQILAPALMQGAKPESIIAQRAIAILAILNDGEWHTTKEIAGKLGITRKYIADILRACKDGWGLASSRRYGWMLPNKKSVIIV